MKRSRLPPLGFAWRTCPRTSLTLCVRAKSFFPACYRLNSTVSSQKQDKKDKKALLEEIGQQLGVTQLSDWYGVKRQDVMKRGGRSIFDKYTSLEKALRTFYPEFAWESSKFDRAPHGFWADVQNQRPLLDKIGRELGVEKLEDWYTIQKAQVVKRGQVLFREYQTLEEALRAVYPEFEWDSSKFGEDRHTYGYWMDVKNQRASMDRIGQELGVKEFSDWYRITRQQVNENGGKPLFGYYTSMVSLLSAVYPEYPWDATNFMGHTKLPRGFWADKANLLKVLEKAETQLGITKPEDWYSVTLADLSETGSSALTKTKLAELLQEKYPGYKWERVYLLRGRYAQQKRLENAVMAMFSGLDIKTNARKEAGVINPETGAYLELDIYIPSLKLAFEYQERHHYTTADYVYKPVEVEKERDRNKKELVKQHDITLVVVPCWWDGRKESLAASIKQVRPDLLPEMVVTERPISEEPPPGFFEKQVHNVEGIGQPVSACFLVQTKTDPTDWFMFEKYDGVRGFWNPTKKTFYSRQGNAFVFPQEIIDSMPTDMFLDGELWFGVDSFQEASKLFKKVDSSLIDWDKFKYMVYDIPTHTGTYSERYNELVNRLGGTSCKYIEVAPMRICKSITHLEEFFQDVVDKGGEGIILRDPNSLLQPGRSPGYLKHKRYRDAEAKVVRSVGQFQWECELPNGVQFVAPAGTTEFTKRWNPQPGDIVSFKHHGYLLASKKPKLPTIYRLRTDLTWQDVVNNWKENKSAPTALPVRRPKTNHRPKLYWRDINNRKKFFCDFAQEKGFDPYLPENWDNISVAQIIANKGTTLMLRYGGSLVAALKDTFPELTWTATEKLPKGYWKDKKNCRNYFDEIAQQKGFDPTDTERWYYIRASELTKQKGVASLLHQYGGIRGALQAAYPELNFNLWQSADE